MRPYVAWPTVVLAAFEWLLSLFPVGPRMLADVERELMLRSLGVEADLDGWFCPAAAGVA